MKIRTFWELITEDSARDGATADHGIVDAEHGFVSMDGVIGDDARQVLDANALDFDLDPEARRFDLIRLGESIVEELDGVDYIDHRGDEVEEDVAHPVIAAVCGARSKAHSGVCGELPQPT